MSETRDRLIKLLSGILPPGYSDMFAAQVADHLLANGVTLKIKKEKPETDLTGKCGSCIFAEPVKLGKSTYYVRCTNSEHVSRYCNDCHRTSSIRQRTTKACKLYQGEPVS